MMLVFENSVEGNEYDPSGNQTEVGNNIEYADDDGFEYGSKPWEKATNKEARIFSTADSQHLAS